MMLKKDLAEKKLKTFIREEIKGEKLKDILDQFFSSSSFKRFTSTLNHIRVIITIINRRIQNISIR